MLELTAALVEGLPQNGPTDPLEYYRRPLIGRLFRRRINIGLGLVPSKQYRASSATAKHAFAVNFPIS